MMGKLAPACCQGERQNYINGFLPFVMTSCASLPCSASRMKNQAKELERPCSTPPAVDRSVYSGCSLR